MFEAPRLGISLLERDKLLPIVDSNNSGRDKPRPGDRVVAVNGERLENKPDAYQFAIQKVKY